MNNNPDPQNPDGKLTTLGELRNALDEMHMLESCMVNLRGLPDDFTTYVFDRHDHTKGQDMTLAQMEARLKELQGVPLWI